MNGTVKRAIEKQDSLKEKFNLIGEMFSSKTKEEIEKEKEKKLSHVDEVVEPLLREFENFREDISHDNDDIVDAAVDAINIAREGFVSLKAIVSS